MKFNFKINKTGYLKVTVPLLVILLGVEIFLIAIGSVDAVFESNKNNFLYSVKIRNTVEEIDKIVERAEVNINMMSDVIALTYDSNNLYDRKYNVEYLKKIDAMTKSVLMNSPGVCGVWFQLNADVPFSSDMYGWYEYRDGKFVNLKQRFKRTDKRVINPKDDPYYYEAVKAKKTIWSEIYKDADTGKVMLSIARPIYKKSVLVGVAGVDISIADLHKALANMQSIFNSSEIYLLNGQGKVIVSQLNPLEENKYDNSYNFLYMFEKRPIHKESMAVFTDDGVQKTAILLALSNKYSVVITFPNSEIFRGFNRLFGIVYIFFAILFALIIVIFTSQNKIVRMNKKLENEKQTLRTIINSSPDMMLIKDLNGVYTDCNDKFLDFIDAKREDIIGTTDYDLFSKNEIDEIIKNDNIVKKDKKTITQEQQYIGPNGKKFYLEKNMVPLYNSDKEIIGILINAFDVTKREEEQEYLQRAKEAAENATMMKSNFLANMSHEIRTPMNGVLGFIQLLKDTNTSEEQAEFIEDAQKSSEMLLEIINDILDFSKIEANKLKMDNISFDIRSVIEDVTLMAASNAEKKQVEVDSLICSDVPQKVFGDPGRIKQVLNNLLGNAVKFTSKGEIIVYVKKVSDNEDTSVISFEVKDSGIGIEQDKLDLIFEAFAQADASMTRKYGGTGLGLAISKKLVDLMNGQFCVKSEIGKGSTFTFSIPFKKDKSIEQEYSNSKQSISGAKILIVNSNPTDSKVMRYYLSEENCAIVEAHSSEEALGLINNKNDKLSVIIIDYKIEKSEDGSLCKLIKENDASKDIPLILYTPLAQRGDAIWAKNAGFKGYLTKPIKKQLLIETVKMVLDEKSDLINNSLITKHLLKEKKFNSKSKILVVEDSKINCKLIIKILSKNGLSCNIATDGNQAIEAYKNKKYDLILMDCQMPILDGYEATKEIRSIEQSEKRQHVPIIAMTANAMVQDKEKCFKVGMDDYISKPIEIANLLNIMSKYIPIETPVATDSKPTEAKDTETIDYIVNKMVKELEFSKKEAIEIFADYLEFLPTAIREIEETVSKEDYIQLKKDAHKLKGSSANLRIEKIAQLGLELENAALAQNKEECTRIVNGIKSHYNKLDSLLSK